MEGGNGRMTAEERYLYALLYAPGHTGEFGEAIRGSTWLQKIMFVLADEIPGLDLRFDGHYLGPYSRSLKAVQHQNIASDFVLRPDGRGPMELGGGGREVAKGVWGGLQRKVQDVISETKGFFNDMTKWELIAFIYSSYPGTARNSYMMGEFEQTRLAPAISPFKSKKVPLDMAPRIAGITLEGTEEKLKGRGIPPYKLTWDTYGGR